MNYAHDQRKARNGWCAKSLAKAGEPSPCKATWRRGPTRNASSRRRKSLRPPHVNERGRLLACAPSSSSASKNFTVSSHEWPGMFSAIEAALLAFGAEGGSIINIGSETIVTADPTLSDLRGVKERSQWLDARALSKEFGPRKIRVNAPNPGGTETEGAGTRRASWERSLRSR